MGQSIISFTAFFVYLLCALAQYLQIKGQRSLPKLKLISAGLLAATLHGYLLYLWIDTPYGQNLSPSHLFSLVSWLISVLILITALYRPIENLSILTLPLAAISLPLALIFPGNNYFQTGLYPLRLTHILISIAAFGILGMALLQAILLQIQTNKIRRLHRPQGFAESPSTLWFLPPLQTMETLFFQIIWLGFIFLTASLASACIFLDNIFEIHWIQKTVFSLLAWGFFAALLYGHYRSGWRGTKALRFTMMGMVLLVVAYFSSKLILLKYW